MLYGLLGNKSSAALAISAATVLLSVSTAWAHGYAISPSTPVSPPLGHEWIAAVTLAAITLANIVLLRVLGLARWRSAIPAGLLVTITFAVQFFCSGWFPGTTTTAPPDAPGVPLPVFWGFGWRRVGLTFLMWNLAGIALLLCMAGSFVFALARRWRDVLVLWVAMGIGILITAIAGAIAAGVFALILLVILRCWRTLAPTKTKAMGILLSANALLYVGGLVPYIASGALSHGWCGGYVHGGCESRIKAIVWAMAGYALDHDDRLPEAASFDELLVKIEPYLDPEQTPRFSYASPIGICPRGAAYERSASPYIWNPRYSGALLDKIPEYPENQEDAVLACPYCGHWNRLVNIWLLCDKDVQKKPASSPSP